MVPYNPASVLLYLAKEKTYRPLWSTHILDEVERNLVAKIGQSPEKAARRVRAMRDAFPDAEVAGYDTLIEAMECDKKDRHVLAAAVRANAEVVVTANLKDFPSAALEPYDLKAVGPDDFLLDQFDLYPEKTLGCLRRIVEVRRKPPETLDYFLGCLEEPLPGFVAGVRRLL